MKTAKAKRTVIAKAGNGGGDIHVGQTLYGPGGTTATVVKIDGGNVTIKHAESGKLETMPLADMTSLEALGLVGFTDPHISQSMRDVQADLDDGGDED